MAYERKNSAIHFFSKRHHSTSNSVTAAANSITSNKLLKLYFQNISGLRTKCSTVYMKSSFLDFDIFVFVESWLNENFFDCEIFDLNLYDVFRKDRDPVKSGCSRGGGVLIAVRRKFRASLVTLTNSDTLIDQLCVRVYGSSGTVYVCASYIPPNSPDYLYFAHADNVVSLASSIAGDSHLCVLGDFNLCRLSWSPLRNSAAFMASNVKSSAEIHVIDSFLSIDLSQINGFYNSLNRILDLVFISNNINYTLSEGIAPISLTDKHHVPLSLELEFYEFSEVSDEPNIKFNYNSCDFSIFNEILLSIDWDNAFRDNDVTSCFNFFKTKVSELCLKHIPIYHKKVYKTPWHTKRLRHLRNLKNKFSKLYKRSGDPMHYSKFQCHLKEFNCLNKFLYRNYIMNFENNIISDSKAFWQYIKSKKSCSTVPNNVFYNSKYANSAIESANLFADFFCSNFEPDLDFNSSLPSNSFSPLNFGTLCLSVTDVVKGIMKLRPTSKTDSDGLSAILLKNCLCLAEPLTIIFNKSLSSGIFVDDWKLTSVTPIFKSGNKNDVTNYRPISKLSSVSKLFEITVNDKLYFAVKGLISTNQHGFVASRSTVTNLSIFNDYCISAFQNGSQVDTIYTDFSKAFDKVSHRILLSKLASMGIHSTFLSWIKSYLSNRHCVVAVDNTTSRAFIASSGVPQGSILGPLLFILFINDIGSCFSFAEHLLYADDLKIFAVINSVSDSEKLQTDLHNVRNWCYLNRLSLNISKCFHVKYAKSNNTLHTSYSIAGLPLQSVEEIKDLGVIFDSKLNFTSHVNLVIRRSYAMLAFVRRNCSAFTNPYTLKTLYCAFVRSRLEYAAVIWRPYQIGLSNRIERVQKVFLRFALRSLNFSEPVPSYRSRCLLIDLKPLDSRRSILSCSFIIRIISGSIDCPSLLSKIQFNIPNMRLRQYETFKIGFSRTNYGVNSPIPRACADLNMFFNSSGADFTWPYGILVNHLKSFFS